MPAASYKMVRVCRYTWKRVMLERCTGCGNVVKGMYYYLWVVYYWDSEKRQQQLRAKSCLEPTCVGQVVNELLSVVPRHAF